MAKAQKRQKKADRALHRVYVLGTHPDASEKDRERWARKVSHDDIVNYTKENRVACCYTYQNEFARLQVCTTPFKKKGKMEHKEDPEDDMPVSRLQLTRPVEGGLSHVIWRTLASRFG